MLGNKRDEIKAEEAKGKVETILGAGTRIEGDIYTRGSIRVEGKIKGNIKADGDLFIGEDGKVETEIEARNVVIAGSVNGNILAHQRVELLPTAKVVGDIVTDILKIEEGARFTGSSKPLEDNKVNSQSKKAKEEAAVTKQKN